MSKILSFDTSNYTTSACVFDTNDGILWENRILLDVKDGECGVRQNDAVFLHTKNLQQLFNEIPKYDYSAVVSSVCPSERENSYMPCFNVGIAFAKSISSILNVEYYGVSHQKNHICSALYSCNKLSLLNSPFIAYHISGGTTDICLCSPSKNGVFTIEKIGGTSDISCGQLIDRTGVMLGLKFPCGKHIESLCDESLTGKIKIKNNNGYFNFSGFQNKTHDMKNQGMSNTQISTFTLDVVYSFVVDSINYFRKIYGDIPVLMAGGVMSNKIIKEHTDSSLSDVYFSKPQYSVDNALGTAVLYALDKGLLL